MFPRLCVGLRCHVNAAEQPREKVLAKDDVPAAETPLPADARWAGAWVRPVDLNGRVNIELRLRDANGRYFTVALDPAVRAALTTPQGHAIAQFARFLAAAVDSSGGGVAVSLWDVRYHAPGSGARGWSGVQVRLR